jgi:hypothetical protein
MNVLLRSRSSPRIYGGRHRRQSCQTEKRTITMLRNILIAAAALSAIAVGSAGSASATGYYSHHYYKPHYNYYKPHHNYYKPHYVQKHYVKKHYNYDYNDSYYVNDCGWQTVKVIRWNHGYRYVDFVKTWTCY